MLSFPVKHQIGSSLTDASATLHTADEQAGQVLPAKPPPRPRFNHFPNPTLSFAIPTRSAMSGPHYGLVAPSGWSMMGSGQTSSSTLGPRMRTRPLLLALGAASALTIGLIAPAAQAATGSSTPHPLDKIAKSENRAATDGDDCTIAGFSPTRLSLGVAAKSVQFGVTTTCDDADHAMKWAATGDLFPGSAHVSWLGACTYAYTGPSVLSCPEGKATVNVIGTGTFKGNAMAGQQNVHLYAFDDANGNNRDDDTSYQCDANGENCVSTASGRDTLDTTIALLRRTSWGSTFQATPATVKKGNTIALTGQLTEANWDTGKNTKTAPAVKLQFKANGETKFRSVRSIAAGSSSTSATVTAKRSGSFRFAYAGDATHAASNSASVHVTVMR